MFAEVIIVVILAFTFFGDDIKRKLTGKSELAKMSSRKRKKKVEELLSLVIAQYRSLAHYREYTGVSSQFGADHIGEIVAALVVGVPGRNRLGKSVRKEDSDKKTEGDLSDGTEVKTSNRTPSPIDFIVRGTIVQSPVESNSKYKALRVDNAIQQCRHLFEGTAYPDYRGLQWTFTDQSGCTIQRLKEYNGKLIGDELILRTRGDPNIRVEGDVMYIRLRPDDPNDRHFSTHCTIKPWELDEMVESGEEYYWWLTKERTQFALINGTFDAFLKRWDSKPILVQIFIDPRGRFSVAVFRLDATAQIRSNFIEKYRSDEGHWIDQKRNKTTGKKLYQPEFFEQHVRTRINPRDFDGFNSLGTHLIMLGHEDKNHKFKVDYWHPKKGVSITKPSVVRRLTKFSLLKECPDVRKTNAVQGLEVLDGGGWIAENRARSGNEFFQNCMAGYLRKLIPYCDLAGAARNPKIFGELAEHLASLVTGLTGSRTGGPGPDLIEADNAISEVKSCTGVKGDILGTEDNPRYDLVNFEKKQRGHVDRDAKDDKLLSWNRLFFVRIIAEGDEEEWCLRCAISTVDEYGMSRFHHELSLYAWNTMLNYHCGSELVQPYLWGHLRERGDNGRYLPIQHAVTFNEGADELVRAPGWDLVNNPQQRHIRGPSCLCSYCSIYQYIMWLRN